MDVTDFWLYINIHCLPGFARNVFVHGVLGGVLLALTHCTEHTMLDSRFMYEYRVLQKMVHLEDDNYDLRNTETDFLQCLEGTL